MIDDWKNKKDLTEVDFGFGSGFSINNRQSSIHKGEVVDAA
jgi:hypothetical protein